jgi:hypothetical protein
VSSGYVYVLSNESMPGLVKIGRSINGGHARSKNIYQTGVAAPFRLEFEIFSAHHEALELLVHDSLQKERVNPCREFFRVDPTWAIVEILSCYMRSILPSDYVVAYGDEQAAAIDLMFLAGKYDLIPAEVLDSTTYLSEFAIRQAVALRRQKLNIKDVVEAQQ